MFSAQLATIYDTWRYRPVALRATDIKGVRSALTTRLRKNASTMADNDGYDRDQLDAPIGKLALKNWELQPDVSGDAEVAAHTTALQARG